MAAERTRSAVSNLDLAYPFTGRWLVQNSPADRVPSHGTHQFASSYAIDFVPVDERGRTAPLSLTSMLRPEPPDRFPGFGRVLTAPARGVVAAVHDGEPDHHAFRGVPSIGYALTQQRRAAQGWTGLGGNHVVIALGSDAFVALCHLRHGSVRVGVGQSIALGDDVGECGNSGNSTEPHVHVQAMDGLELQRARAIPVTFHGTLPRNREIVDVR
jgi:murein DD-endopeptidase MepM/ murein hydrolase activator NlpD